MVGLLPEMKSALHEFIVYGRHHACHTPGIFGGATIVLDTRILVKTKHFDMGA